MGNFYVTVFRSAIVLLQPPLLQWVSFSPGVSFAGSGTTLDKYLFGLKCSSC